jgi:cytochrome c5
MGPDHAQVEIYHESKHGVLFNAQKGRMNLAARPEALTTRDMPVPTCSTCHMSGLEGEKVTHDTSERLSYYLFAAVSDRRPNYERGRRTMRATCLKCHTNPRVLQFYAEAEGVVRSTNQLVREAERIIAGLRKEQRLTPEPFDEPIEFLAFDLWHSGGRTAKHGAFMGGADFVQWHGYYEVVSKLAELKAAAAELRRKEEPVRPRGPSEGEGHAPSTAR